MHTDLAVPREDAPPDEELDQAARWLDAMLTHGERAAKREPQAEEPPDLSERDK